MIEIEKLKSYFDNDMVFVTAHAAERFHQRAIIVSDIRNAVRTGEIIEQYPDDYPFPSCLILGDDSHGNKLHVCMSDEDTSSRIITANYPDPDKWQNGMRTRKG